MRVWGRRPKQYPANGVVQSNVLTYGSYDWVAIETTCDGDDSWVYICALVQAIRLNLQESPFYATIGIPAETEVLMQLQPDYYINRIQQTYSKYFASLIVTKEPQVPSNNNFGPGDQSYLTPIYNIYIVTLRGQNYATKVAV